MDRVSLYKALKFNQFSKSKFTSSESRVVRSFWKVNTEMLKIINATKAIDIILVIDVRLFSSRLVLMK